MIIPFKNTCQSFVIIFTNRSQLQIWYNIQKKNTPVIQAKSLLILYTRVQTLPGRIQTLHFLSAKTI